LRVLGIDLGSREVKIVVMENSEITYKTKLSTITFYKDYCSYDGELVADLDRLGIGSMERAVSTGYGRNTTNLKMFKPINEIKAHVYGALYQTGLKDFILLDVGGQDVKVVKVEKGIAADLELNEKCAASCGRYLENMSAILEIPLEEMCRYHENPVELNSTCAVFSESELIAKIVEGADMKNLCAGVNYSLYKRLQPLLSRFKGKQLVLSGGVAFNTALGSYLKNDYDEVIVLAEPQFNGAIGCCSYAGRKGAHLEI